MLQLSEIWIYPVKSLGGIKLLSSREVLVLRCCGYIEKESCLNLREVKGIKEIKI